MKDGGTLIKLYNAKDVAPAPGSVSLPAKWLGIGVIVAAALLWIVLANTFAPPKPVVITATPAKTEAPQPQPAPAPAPQAPCPMFCQGESFKTKNGLLICGVYAVDNEYVWIQRGWIAPAGNFTATFRIFGDVSGCLFQIAGSRLVVECQSPIAVGR